MAKAMKDFEHYFGLKLRIYPDYQQRKIIKINSDANVDSSAIDNAKKNYQAAWNLYRKTDSHGTPNFHRNLT